MGQETQRGPDSPDGPSFGVLQRQLLRRQSPISKLATLGADRFRQPEETTEQRASEWLSTTASVGAEKITANENDSLVPDADLAEIEAFANGDVLVCA
ncbi:hypothetical protein BKG61_17690 [Mycobacterium syngnathidarum]|uniref:Uncharacterized protein n=2 Tax=Mycobacteriaceae TaxID=1762 RepID=A0A1S1JZ86_9MYCO|nr:hypothetical protein [Mycolicibacterium lutetiense]OHT97121.1 hypothetical protein BKG61_17690 [Mycobacterium syngnathidarum]